jgi:hypothetical protein
MMGRAEVQLYLSARTHVSPSPLAGANPARLAPADVDLKHWMPVAHWLSEGKGLSILALMVSGCYRPARSSVGYIREERCGAPIQRCRCTTAPSGWHRAGRHLACHPHCPRLGIGGLAQIQTIRGENPLQESSNPVELGRTGMAIIYTTLRILEIGNECNDLNDKRRAFGRNHNPNRSGHYPSMRGARRHA